MGQTPCAPATCNQTADWAFDLVGVRQLTQDACRLECLACRHHAFAGLPDAAGLERCADVPIAWCRP